MAALTIIIWWFLAYYLRKRAKREGGVYIV